MPMSDPAHQYLHEALSHIEERSVKRDVVDWSVARAAAHREAEDAVEPADTYSAVRAALLALNDRHSFLVPAHEARQRAHGMWTGLGLHALGPDGVIVQVHPGSPADRAGLAVGDTIVAMDGKPLTSAETRPLPLHGRESVVLEVRRQGVDGVERVALQASPYAVGLLPRSRLLNGSIGYIELPEQLSGGDWGGGGEPGQEYAETAQRIIRELEGQGARAWIIDLRRNPGGDMFPMIAGLGPLLGEGTCCYFVGPGGTLQPIGYHNGEASDGQTVWARVEDPYVLARATPPVAVLIGPLTASSGEFTALALRNRPMTRLFGEPTYGVPTGNETKVLSDGAVLFLTVCLGADRAGETFDGPIPPDEVVPSRWAEFGHAGDTAVSRAIDWIDTVITAPNSA